MNRYTSPELSKQLAEAGLEQLFGTHGPHYWNDLRPLDGLEGTRPYVSQYNQTKDSVRALDLIDVIEELTKERDGGPLASYVRTEHTTWGRFTCAADESSRPSGTLVLDGHSTVEAAGRVLLQLLKERAK